FLAGAGVPQSIHEFVPHADAFAVKTQRSFHPGRTVIGGHLERAGQTLALLARAPTTAGLLWWWFIEGGLHGHATDQVHVAGQMTADGTPAVFTISGDLQGAMGSPTGYDLNHLQASCGRVRYCLGLACPVCLRSHFPPRPGAQMCF